MGAGAPDVLSARGHARAVRGVAARARHRAGDGAGDRRIAPHDDAPRPRRSWRGRRRHRASRVLPRAARAEAGAETARRTATTLRAGRAPDAGAVPHTGATVRLPLTEHRLPLTEHRLPLTASPYR